jgi:ADP-heptose:LPS heptosyltransferase
MKVLIIRFSSLGDVLQTLSVAGRIRASWPEAEIHWVTRQEFVPLIESHPAVSKVLSLKKGEGFGALLRLGRALRKEKYTHVYDAHNNLRSHLLGWMLNGFLGWRRWTGRHKFLRRSIYRWRRFLLFRFRRNYFPKPFSGQFALLEPLREWGLSVEAPATPQLFLPQAVSEKVRAAIPEGEFVALAPSAAFELKRWPISHWKELISLFPDTKFAVLGGPEDSFLKELEIPGRVFNLAGRLSLNESAQVIARSRALVSNDTGLMHVAEQIGKPCLALMGPAPFGFPSRPATQIFELNLPCRPCSKHGQGPCINPEFQQCLRGIAPTRVAQSLRSILSAALASPLPR